MTINTYVFIYLILFFWIDPYILSKHFHRFPLIWSSLSYPLYDCIEGFRVPISHTSFTFTSCILSSSLIPPIWLHLVLSCAVWWVRGLRGGGFPSSHISPFPFPLAPPMVIPRVYRFSFGPHDVGFILHHSLTHLYVSLT